MTVEPVRIRFVGGPLHNHHMVVPDLLSTYSVPVSPEYHVSGAIDWNHPMESPMYRIVYYHLRRMAWNNLRWFEYHYKGGENWEKCGGSGTTIEPILGFELSFVWETLLIVANRCKLRVNRRAGGGNPGVLHSYES